MLFAKLSSTLRLICTEPASEIPLTRGMSPLCLYYVPMGQV